MNKKLSILAMILCCCFSAFGGGAKRPKLIRDGFALTGIEGKLIKAKPQDQAGYMKFEQDDVWLFGFNADVNDFMVVVKGPVRMQLLPSTALGKIVTDAGEHPDSTYRLWGRITKYRGANYIFPEFFLPVVEITPVDPVVRPSEPNDLQLSEVKELKAAARPVDVKEPNEPPVEPAPPEKTELPKVLTDPNSVLEIPAEVLEKLGSKKIVLPRKMQPKVEEIPEKLEPRKIDLPNKIKPATEPNEQPQDETLPEKEPVKKPEQAEDQVPAEVEEKNKPAKRPAMKLDSVLADRTAMLERGDGGRIVFVLDALGLSVRQATLHLLPCEALELAEMTNAAALDRARFKIAGIKTEYKGRDYLLLQKAIRAYGHGNFGD
ncbi:MAG: hypothetical protein JW720_04635 [Sedimentisphaerales bacterium]|nr:hypothetical protein [Sedimentisphaerales bacterium]